MLRPTDDRMPFLGWVLVCCGKRLFDAFVECRSTERDPMVEPKREIQDGGHTDGGDETGATKPGATQTVTRTRRMLRRWYLL